MKALTSLRRIAAFAAAALGLMAAPISFAQLAVLADQPLANSPSATVFPFLAPPDPNGVNH